VGQKAHALSGFREYRKREQKGNPVVMGISEVWNRLFERGRGGTAPNRERQKKHKNSSKQKKRNCIGSGLHLRKSSLPEGKGRGAL